MSLQLLNQSLPASYIAMLCTWSKGHTHLMMEYQAIREFFAEELLSKLQMQINDYLPLLLLNSPAADWLRTACTLHACASEGDVQAYCCSSTANVWTILSLRTLPRALICPAGVADAWLLPPVWCCD
jgi:hypothetical protein